MFFTSFCIFSPRPEPRLAVGGLSAVRIAFRRRTAGTCRSRELWHLRLSLYYYRNYYYGCRCRAVTSHVSLRVENRRHNYATRTFILIFVCTIHKLVTAAVVSDSDASGEPARDNGPCRCPRQNITRPPRSSAVRLGRARLSRPRDKPSPRHRVPVDGLRY